MAQRGNRRADAHNAETNCTRREGAKKRAFERASSAASLPKLRCSARPKAQLGRAKKSTPFSTFSALKAHSKPILRRNKTQAPAAPFFSSASFVFLSIFSIFLPLFLHFSSYSYSAPTERQWLFTLAPLLSLSQTVPRGASFGLLPFSFLPFTFYFLPSCLLQFLGRLSGSVGARGNWTHNSGTKLSSSACFVCLKAPV